MIEYIKVKGAKENNLKNISVDVPRDKLVVFTGLSGSGKSTLAFDTIFAEGQRKYMESLSSYARMFLGQMEEHRGLVAGYLHRPENDIEQPAFYCRDGNRNLRLFKTFIRESRRSSLSEVRQSYRKNNRRSDCR